MKLFFTYSIFFLSFTWVSSAIAQNIVQNYNSQNQRNFQDQTTNQQITTPRFALNPAKIQLHVIGETIGPALPVSPSLAALTPSFLSVNSHGEVYLRTMPFFNNLKNSMVGRSTKGELIHYSIDPELHALAKKLIESAISDHIAAVAMDPHTGRILALAEKSNTLNHPLLHSGYPAASLFKVITSAAALERGVITPWSKINFRGGTYQLDRRNYSNEPRLDRNSMSVTAALGRSCNPVFGKIALRFLNASLLKKYTIQFGFDSDLKFDIPLSESHANIINDPYEISRIGAGFGDVRISPIHAAAMMSAVANRGLMPRPFVVQSVYTQNSVQRYSAKPQVVKQVIKPETAKALLQMMESTTTKGTARKDFFYRGQALLPRIRVAGKTGTLRGNNPVGLNRWFIGAAPIEAPRIAVAIIAVNPVNGVARPAYIARRLIENYLKR